MKRILLTALMLLALMSGKLRAQVTFDIVSVEAYIHDHKKQRSLLLARSTLEYSNKLLHEYSREEVGGYKELNVDLDRYTRAFDVIDVMYQSLRTVLNVKDTYRTVSDRIGDYKTMLEVLAPAFAKVYTVTPDCPRALSGADLQKEARFHMDAEAAPSVPEALRAAVRYAEENNLAGVVVCGSLYLAAEARPWLLKEAEK